MVAFGIDIGTGYVRAALLAGKTPVLVHDAEGASSLPAVVAFEKGGVRVGRAAVARAAMHHDTTIRGIKWWLGRPCADANHPDALRAVAAPSGNGVFLRLGGELYEPEQIASELLRHCVDLAAQRAGVRPTSVVLAAPPWLGVSGRKALVNAAGRAGLTVDRVVSEAAAAALTLAAARQIAEHVIAIVDVGAGGFTASVVHIRAAQITEISSVGDDVVAGETIDRAIAELVLRKAGFSLEGADAAGIGEMMRQTAETMKCDVSALGEARAVVPFLNGAPSLVIEQGELELLLGDLLQRLEAVCTRALAEAGISAARLDAVHVTGGMSQLAAVRSRIERVFQRAAVVLPPATGAVALGAAMVAGMLAGDLPTTAIGDRASVSLAPDSPPYRTVASTSPPLFRGAASPSSAPPTQRGPTASVPPSRPADPTTSGAFPAGGPRPGARPAWSSLPPRMPVGNAPGSSRAPPPPAPAPPTGSVADMLAARMRQRAQMPSGSHTSARPPQTPRAVSLAPPSPQPGGLLPSNMRQRAQTQPAPPMPPSQSVPPSPAAPPNMRERVRTQPAPPTDRPGSLRPAAFPVQRTPMVPRSAEEDTLPGDAGGRVPRFSTPAPRATDRPPALATPRPTRDTPTLLAPPPRSNAYDLTRSPSLAPRGPAPRPEGASLGAMRLPDLSGGRFARPASPAAMLGLAVTRPIVPADMWPVALPVLLLRMLARDSVRGIVTLEHAGKTAMIPVLDGRACLSRSEHAAVTQAFAWPDGAYTFEAKEFQVGIRSTLSMLRLTIDGLRVVCRSFTVDEMEDTLGPRLDLAPVLKPDAGRIVSRFGLTTGEARVLEHGFDGTATARRLQGSGVDRHTVLELVLLLMVFDTLDWYQPQPAAHPAHDGAQQQTTIDGPVTPTTQPPPGEHA